MSTDETLADILRILRRIEERQIKTTAMVQEIEGQEQTQVQGSFGSVDQGEK